MSGEIILGAKYWRIGYDEWAVPNDISGDERHVWFSKYKGSDPKFPCVGTLTVERFLEKYQPATPEQVLTIEGPTGDQMVTDPETGGRKGSKTARFDLIPTGPLWSLAEHYGKGARKYADRNWELGYKWSLSYAAAQRHLNLFWSGNPTEYDATIGGDIHHLDAAIFHLMALREFERTHPEKDDRAKNPGGNPSATGTD